MRVLGVIVVLGLAGCDQTFGLAKVHLGVDAAVVERPDAALGVCGKIGTECCTTGTSCTDGSACFTTQGRARCIAFGGGYAQNNEALCGATPCLTPNPFTGDCSCPAGFAEKLTASIDEGCTNTKPPANETGIWKICAVDQPPAASDWGGAYLQGDLEACVANVPSTGCEVPNAVTGDCTCPPDAEVVRFRVFLPEDANASCTNPYLGGTFGVCIRNAVTAASILGAFQVSPDDVCVHSAGLAGCACPPLSNPIVLRTIEETTAPSSFAYTSPTICLAAP